MPRCGSAPMAVPINWHFKPEEINYVLKDSGTSRPDRRMPTCCIRLRGAIPAGVTVLSVPTPPEILANYKVDPDHLAAPDFATDLRILAASSSRADDGPAVPQPQNMIYTSGTTGHPKGVRRIAPTPEQTASAGTRARDDLWPEAGRPRRLPGPLYHSAPNSFGLRCGRLGGALVLMPRFDRGGIPAPDRGARGSTPSSWCRPCSSA